jgi:hypothetical protein
LPAAEWTIVSSASSWFSASTIGPSATARAMSSPARRDDGTRDVGRRTDDDATSTDAPHRRVIAETH